MRESLILERLYGAPRRSRRERLEQRLRALQREVGRWLEHQSWTLALAAASLAMLIVATGFYYNRLLILEYDVELARVQIEAGEQRRSHVTRNLTQLVRYYARHEKELMTDVTKLRNAQRGKAGALESADGTAQLLGRLNLVAEQYPSLHLTNTVQQFTTTIVNTESEIAAYIISYNAAVNIYSITLNTFPARVFGVLLRFHAHPFYKPRNSAALVFQELKL
jgi:LemA protein